MKKTTAILALTTLLGAGTLFAHGNEKHADETQMQMPVQSNMETRGMGMDPAMRKEMQQNMQAEIIAIINSEISQPLSQVQKDAIRAKLQKSMDKMSQKMEKMMQEKKGNGMGKRGMKREKGMNGGGMMPERTQKGDMPRIKMH